MAEYFVTPQKPLLNFKGVKRIYKITQKKNPKRYI